MGKEKDNETGLYYYGARYYVAWTCRFVSVDPLASKYPQLTPYNYAANDPIGDLDIDGMQNTKTEEGGGSGGGSAKQVPDRDGLPTFELPAVDVVGVAAETLPWYLGENKYGGKPVLTLGLGTLPTTTKMNYDKTSWTNPSEKLAIFITNAGIGLWNNLANSWNDEKQGKTGPPALMKLDSDIGYALTHTTMEDVKNAVTDVNTYENAAGLAFSFWATKRLGSLGSGSSAVKTGGLLPVEGGAGSRLLGEYRRFQAQGFNAGQAQYLTRSYTGMGHHFIPRRTSFPSWLVESRLNIMGQGMSRGRFYERHFLGDRGHLKKVVGLAA